MRVQDLRVPEAVEEYLVGLNARAGQLGGGIGGGLAGARRAGERGGARGGARGARMLKTVVEERSGVASGTAGEVLGRVLAAVPQVRRLGGGGDLVRVAVPVGRTGLQHVVVDLVFGPPVGATAGPETLVRVRAYGKEGRLYRKSTADVADQVWEAVSQ